MIRKFYDMMPKDGNAKGAYKDIDGDWVEYDKAQPLSPQSSVGVDSLPDFLYKDNGEVFIGYHGDSICTDEWNKWLTEYSQLVSAEKDKESFWTDDLVKNFAEQYRFSSSRTSLQSFKKTKGYNQQRVNENYESAIEHANADLQSLLESKDKEIEELKAKLELYEERENDPYWYWPQCDVDGCEGVSCNGGGCWRETGYWSVCSKHSQDFRDGKPQPKMKQSSIDKEATRDKVTGCLPSVVNAVQASVARDGDSSNEDDNQNPQRIVEGL